VWQTGDSPGDFNMMNATDNDYFAGKVRGPSGRRAYEVRVFDRFLGAEPHVRIESDSAGVIHLNIAVEQGGTIRLEPAEK
jgi:hypothetical protein